MDDSFLGLISHIKDLNYNTLLKLLLLAFMRMAGICSMAPFLGAKIMPIVGRVALAFSLTLVMLPTIYLNSEGHNSTVSSLFLFYSMKEIMIGIAIGYLVSVPFYIAESSGIYIDYARGASSLMGQNPTTQGQASSIGIMMNYYLIVLFWGLGCALLFFDAVATSYEVVPVDAFIPRSFYQQDQYFWTRMIDLLNEVFTNAIQLAAPSLLAILMAESFLGIANRMAPNVQIAFLGMPLKSLLGLMMLWAGWYIFVQVLGGFSVEWIDHLQRLIKSINR